MLKETHISLISKYKIKSKMKMLSVNENIRNITRNCCRCLMNKITISITSMPHAIQMGKQYLNWKLTNIKIFFSFILHYLPNNFNCKFTVISNPRNKQKHYTTILKCNLLFSIPLNNNKVQNILFILYTNISFTRNIHI